MEEGTRRGLLWLRPDLMRLPGTSAVVTAAVDSTRVAILTGGGAGHEPAHVGFVGKGLLDGAVSGDVFASPSHKAVVAAITHFRGAAGVLLVVKNYNGDCVNFKIAAEIARSQGIDVQTVIFGDDVVFSEVPNSDSRGIDLEMGVLINETMSLLTTDEYYKMSVVVDRFVVGRFCTVLDMCVECHSL